MDRDPDAAPQPPPGPAPARLDPEDYYYEGPYLVFTAAYHLKRGYCCGSGCRHCPYRDKDGPPPGSRATESG
jgi:Family of unknown function (DUF5522)